LAALVLAAVTLVGVGLGTCRVLAEEKAAPKEVSAASHYIRAGATGGSNNGSSWANAWTSFSSVTWTRGDTYFVAGGTYSENVVVAKALSGSQWITIKKANATDNSQDAGWSAPYATDQASINGTVRLSDGYIEFDGVTGSGTTGHGIKINNANDSHILTLGANTGPYHVFHCEVRGRTRLSEKGFDGIYNNNYTSLQKGLHIANCWIHEIGRNGFTGEKLFGTSYSDYAMLFENNVMEVVGGNLAGAHSQGMQMGMGGDSYFIIRNNIFKKHPWFGNDLLPWRNKRESPV